MTSSSVIEVWRRAEITCALQAHEWFRLRDIRGIVSDTSKRETEPEEWECIVVLGVPDVEVLVRMHGHLPDGSFGESQCPCEPTERLAQRGGEPCSISESGTIGYPAVEFCARGAPPAAERIAPSPV